MMGLRLPLLMLLVFVMAACSRPVPRLEGEVTRSEPWRQETVEQMASVMVQDNGRLKPLSVLAAFRLYDIHGRRDLKYSVEDASGVEKKFTLEPTEWLLDVICYPSQAARYPLFRIEHSGVLDALEIENDGQKPDFVYITYDQASQAGQKLHELATAYLNIEQKLRSTVEQHILELWSDYRTYDRLQLPMFWRRTW